MNHGLIYNTGIESFVIATAYFNLDEQRFVKTEPPQGACVLRCAPFEAAQILSGAKVKPRARGTMQRVAAFLAAAQAQTHESNGAHAHTQPKLPF